MLQNFLAALAQPAHPLVLFLDEYAEFRSNLLEWFAQVKVKVNSVKAEELPELDDDFASEASEFDTLDELKDDLRTRARRMKQIEQAGQIRDKVLEQLLDTGATLRIATEDLPGVQALQRNIIGITNALDTSTASGRRFQAALSALINTSGGGLAGLLNPERLLGGMERLMGLIVRVTPYARAFTQGFGAGFSQALGPLRMLWGVMERLVPSLAATQGGGSRMLAVVTLLGRGFGALAGIVAGAATAFVSIGIGITTAFAVISGVAVSGAAAILGLVSSLGAAALTVGQAIVNGLVAGITSIPGRVATTVSGVAHQAIDGVRDTLGIHSPSRVMMELGAHTAEGFALGVGGGGA